MKEIKRNKHLNTRLVKRLTLFIFISFFSFCVFILYCNFGYSLTNNKKTQTDLIYSVDNNYVIWCQVSSRSIIRNHNTYKENPDELRFIYEILVTHNNRSAVKLNEFNLTYLNGSPLYAKYYVETFTKDSITNNNVEQFWELKNLPIVLRDSGEYKAHYVRIFAETAKPYSKLKSLKVHYDFEVGNNRYKSDNVEYKYHWHCDCDSQINIH